MKAFLDGAGADGARYISDFPDDLLWDHPNAIILPHLGASTEEAEDQAVRSYVIVFFFFVSVQTCGRQLSEVIFASVRACVMS